MFARWPAGYFSRGPDAAGVGGIRLRSLAVAWVVRIAAGSGCDESGARRAGAGGYWVAVAAAGAGAAALTGLLAGWRRSHSTLMIFHPSGVWIRCR